MRSFSCIAFLLIVQSLCTQEALRPLHSNRTGFSEFRQTLAEGTMSSRVSNTSLQIPFKEDFYYATVSRTPTNRLWIDTGYRANSVYVNTGFPIAPPSIGVATFDGLNDQGYPFDPTLPNLTLSRPADILTSRAINLQVAGTKTLMPSDSVALMFYYQMRGYGDSPEVSDTLMVDLYDADSSRWVPKVWWVKGTTNANAVDTAFYRAFIRIEEPRFFHENFQFRIRNRATTAGDFDHWHVDYVIVDQQLYNKDMVFDDLTFGYVPSSMLENYSAMPFNQYRPNEMTDFYEVKIKNNNNQVISMSYRHKVFDEAGTEIRSYDGGPANLRAFSDTGYSRVQAHAYVNLISTYTLPLMTDSTDFKVEHVLQRSGSNINEPFRNNDTVLQFQKFRNYYAFDDGGAESGYYVNAAGARIAVKIKLNEGDTLQALRIYFDPAGNIKSAEEAGFRILVWPERQGFPSSAPLHSFTTVYKQKYLQSAERAFPEYALPQPVFLEAGTYYVGIQQQATTVTVGFDRNYDARKNLFYDSGAGWKQSTIKGALMMRPVFGKKILPPVGIKEQSAGELSIYPNPSAEFLTIDPAHDQSWSYELYNSAGSRVISGTCVGAKVIDVSGYAEGMYFISGTSEQGTRFSGKILIRR